MSFNPSRDTCGALGCVGLEYPNSDPNRCVSVGEYGPNIKVLCSSKYPVVSNSHQTVGGSNNNSAIFLNNSQTSVGVPYYRARRLRIAGTASPSESAIRWLVRRRIPQGSAQGWQQTPPRQASETHESSGGISRCYYTAPHSSQESNFGVSRQSPISKQNFHTGTHEVPILITPHSNDTAIDNGHHLWSYIPSPMEGLCVGLRRTRNDSNSNRGCAALFTPRNCAQAYPPSPPTSPRRERSGVKHPVSQNQPMKPRPSVIPPYMVTTLPSVAHSSFGAPAYLPQCAPIGLAAEQMVFHKWRGSMAPRGPFIQRPFPAASRPFVPTIQHVVDFTKHSVSRPRTRADNVPSGVMTCREATSRDVRIGSNSKPTESYMVALATPRRPPPPVLHPRLSFKQNGDWLVPNKQPADLSSNIGGPLGTLHETSDGEAPTTSSELESAGSQSASPPAASAKTTAGSRVAIPRLDLKCIKEKVSTDVGQTDRTRGSDNVRLPNRVFVPKLSLCNVSPILDPLHAPRRCGEQSNLRLKSHKYTVSRKQEPPSTRNQTNKAELTSKPQETEKKEVNDKASPHQGQQPTVRASAVTQRDAPRSIGRPTTAAAGKGSQTARCRGAKLKQKTNSKHDESKYPARVAAHDNVRTGAVLKPHLSIPPDIPSWSKLSPDDLTFGAVYTHPLRPVTYDTINSGTFCTVYRGAYKGSLVAIKCAEKHHLATDPAMAFHRAYQEWSILARARHPNVLQLTGGVIQKSEVWLVTELVTGGDLYTLLHNRAATYLRPATRLKMMKQLASALSFLHGLNPKIVHKDMKSNNILVDQNLNVKICDFGDAELMHGPTLQCYTAATWQYAPPEIISAEDPSRPEGASEKVDIWALGCIFLEICLRPTPFKTELQDSPETLQREVLCQLLMEGRLVDEKRNMRLPPILKTLICLCIEITSNDRPSAEQVYAYLEKHSCQLLEEITAVQADFESQYSAWR